MKTSNRPFISVFRALCAATLLFTFAATRAAVFNPDPQQMWKDWQTGAVAVRTPQLRDGKVYALSPAEIVYFAAIENKVNPILLLVKIQHEQKLMTNAYPDSDLQRRLDRATGFGIFDTTPTKSGWPGFYPQLVAASYQFGDVWKRQYASFDDALSKYSTDKTAAGTVKAIYRDYSTRMNLIASKSYAVAPTGWHYVDDFLDVSPSNIQQLLDQLPTRLKDRGLFTGGQASLPPPTQDGMAFVTETLRDGSYVNASSTVPKSWTLRNSGTSIWTSAYCLKPQGTAMLGSAIACVNGSVTPGGQYQFNVNLSVPSAQSTEQQLKGNWGLINASGAQVGATVWAQVKVAARSNGGTGTSATIAMPLNPMPGASQSFAHLLNYKTSACHFLGLHTGVDYAPVSVGQAVFAIADGTVLKTGQIGKTASSLGSYVVVDHPQLGIRSYYLHIVPSVSVGAKVSAGARVASIASTSAVGKHLHLEIQRSTFNVFDSNGKPKLFVGHSTSPIGNCGYVTRSSDLAKGWVNPAEFLKHPTNIGGSGQHQANHEDVDEEDFPLPSDQKRRADVVSAILSALASKNHRFIGSVDEQARSAGLIASATLTRPQDAASRMEVALFAFRALQKFAPSALTGTHGAFPIEEFADASDATAAEYQRTVNALVGAGVVTGARDASGEMRFYPTRKASTSEVQAFVDRTAAKIAGAVTTPVPIPLNIVRTGVNPTNVSVGQQMTFSVQVDNSAAVERAELAFTDKNVLAEALVQTGNTNTWTRTRVMSQAGDNRPFQIRVYKKGGGTILLDGTYSVLVSPAIPRLRDEVPPVVECPVRGNAWTRSNASPAHKVGGGIGGADDSNAMDLNQNASTFNADAGLAVYAVADGDVYAGNGWGANSYGQLLINHTDAEGRRWSSGYLHMTNKTTASRVIRGDIIGRIGRVGVDNDHLHFAVYVGHGGKSSINRVPTCNWVGTAVPGDAMQYVGETLPDNSYIGAAGPTAKSWTLRNTGSTTWNSAYCLRPNGAQTLGNSSACVSGSVPPNATYVFNVSLQAPLAQPAEQSYRQDWVLRNASNTQIGTAVYALVRVRGATPPGPPSPPIPSSLNIQTFSASPQSVQAGQQMSFSVSVDNPGQLQKAEVVFTDVNLTESLSQSAANVWSRPRTMATTGANRPYRIVVTKKDGTTISRDGVYSVNALAQPPTPQPAVNIVGIGASPTQVSINQQMTFQVSVDGGTGVQRIELIFADAGVTEVMTQSGANSWQRSRAMTQVGSNRTYRINVVKKDGTAVSRDGLYTVTSAPPPPAIQEGMAFVGETLPDGSYVNASSTVQKSWTLRNSGTSTWTSAYCLRPQGAAVLGSSSACVNGSVSPGGQYQFNVNLNVPTAQSTEQQLKGSWGLINASGAQVGATVWALVKVRAQVASPPPPPSLRDGMAFVGETLQDGSYVNASSTAQKSWTLRNSGTSTWTSAYCLRPQGATVLGSASACVNGSVAPGGQYQFNVNLNVPAVQSTEQTLKGNWGLINGSGVQVGPTVWAQVRVRASTPLPAPPTPPTLRDGMQFVGETLPDGSYVNASSAVQKSWTLRNSGTSTWTSAYCLKPQGAAVLGSSGACVNGTVAPGGQYQFNVNLNVPAAQSMEQTLKENWGLINASGAQVGATVWALVKVRAQVVAPPPPPPPPPPAPPAGEVPNAPGCGTAGGFKVCGADGRTYPNACTLMKYGVARVKSGPC